MGKCKKPVKENYIFYDSIYIKWPEYRNLLYRQKSIEISSCPKLSKNDTETTAKGYRFSFGGGKNVLKLGSGDDCTTL
jgi:hypothetical protein